MLKLDLHRTRHADVPRKVEQFLNDNWLCGELAEIITGNSQKMRDIVIESLNDYGVFYRISDSFSYIAVYFEDD